MKNKLTENKNIKLENQEIKTNYVYPNNGEELNELKSFLEVENEKRLQIIEQYKNRTTKTKILTQNK